MKMRFVLSLAAILAAAHLGLPAPVPAQVTATPAFSAEEQGLFDRLVAFDKALRHRLRYVEEMAGAGREPHLDLGREAERFQRRLRHLEGELRALGESATTMALLDKVRALERTLGNLERAAEIAACETVDLERLRGAWPAPERPAAGVPLKDGGPANDECANALPIGEGTFAGDTSAATPNPMPSDCGYSIFSPDVWFRYSSQVSATVFAHTYGSSFDTVLSVYRGCPETGEGSVSCNDNTFGLQSAVSFTYTHGQEIYLRLSGFAGSTGAFLLTVDRGGAIAGTVTAAATGEPVPSLQVLAYSEDGYYGGTATTDPAGAYTISGLLAGAYYVRIGGQSAYVTELFDDVPCPLGECDLAAGDPVPVTLGSITAGIDFALDVGGGISGSVTAAADGEPIRGAWVDVYDAEGADVTDRHTDELGRYAVSGLIAGNYFVRVDSTDYFDELYDDLPCDSGCDPTSGTQIPVSLGATTAGIDFVLDRFGQITGTVTDRVTGEPVWGAEIDVWNANGASRFDFADSSGRYTIGGVYPGTYFVRAWDDDYFGEIYDGLPCPDRECDPRIGTPIAVTDNSTAAGIDFALTRLGAVSGTVTDAATGAPISDNWAFVAVWHEDGYWAGEDRIYGSGRYEVEELWPGSFFAVTRTERYRDEIYDGLPCLPDGCDPSSGTPIAVELETTTEGIDFALDELGAITGTVVEEATGEPIRADVELWDAGGRRIAGRETDTQGRYRFDELEPPGPYFVTARKRGFAGELYDDLPCPSDGSCDPATGMPVTVALGATTGGIDFVLTRLAAITGRVRDRETGQIIEYGCVRVWDEEGSQVVRACIDFIRGTSYTAHSLEPGTYFATADAGAYAEQLYDGLPCPDGCDPTAGTPITVETNATTDGIDFLLDPLGSISGTVRDALTGETIDWGEVNVWNAAGEWVTNAWLGGSDFTTGPLEPGTYFLTAEADDYLSELYRELPCPDDCDPTTGTPVAVALGATVGGIDFTLEPVATELLGGFSGTVTDRATGQPIPDVRVRVWDAGGDSVEGRDTDSWGRYALYLPAGTYFASFGGSHAYHPELFDDLPCDAAPPGGCDPLTGTPITVTVERMTPDVDFRLRSTAVFVCEPTATTLCLGGGRFQVTLDWLDHQGDAGAGRAVGLTPDTGYFWFSHPDNVEVVLKVHDACVAPYDRFWVFAAGLTDVEVTLTVIDSWTGEFWPRTNPLGTAFAPIQDTQAFATCGTVPPAATPAATWEGPAPRRRPRLVSTPGDCLAGDTALCLNGDRFQVEVDWLTPAGAGGAARAVPLTADSGYFWFSSPDNVELVIKVHDACVAPYDRFWVFAAGLTDVEVTLTVTDTDSGEVREYTNSMGTAFAPIQDTQAFDTCP